MFARAGERVHSIGLPLFVPANRLDRLAKAVAAAPDAIILDLEDAVDPSDRDAARSMIAASLGEMPLPALLRVNAVDTPWHEADLAAAAILPIAALIVPKAESAADLARIADRVGKPVVALIETARGMADVMSIAGSTSRLAFGSVDFAADLGIGHTRLALLTARSRIVEASRLAELPPPFDGVTLALQDAEMLRDDCSHALELGFGGKLLIHPAQIAPAREAMAPPAGEVRWARRVLDAAASATGVFKLDGLMVDAPVLQRARRILERVS